MNPQPFRLVLSCVMKMHLFSAPSGANRGQIGGSRKPGSISISGPLIFPFGGKSYQFFKFLLSDRYFNPIHGLDFAVFHHVGVEIQGDLCVAVAQDFREYLVVLRPLLDEPCSECGAEGVTGEFFNPGLLADPLDLPVDLIFTEQSTFNGSKDCIKCHIP